MSCASSTATVAEPDGSMGSGDAGGRPDDHLYYMQGIHTTLAHAHTAMFGVYGFLSLGLVLLVFRRLKPKRAWRDAPSSSPSGR